MKPDKRVNTMKNILILVLMTLMFTLYHGNSRLLSNELLTVPEKTNFEKTSLYDDVMNFLFEIQKKSGIIKVLSLCKSFEGRIVPLVVLSEEGINSTYELKMTGKQVVLVQANIHAGEVEGKEACLMLIRDVVQGKLENLLQNQVILVIPIFNPDGNEKLGQHNRHDNGPELAGIRQNGQNLDLNRDFLKLESPEVTALVNLLNEWDPILFVDMHTKNGSYHRLPVTYSTFMHPNSDQAMFDYMWETLLPEVEKLMKQHSGYEAMPYGNFADRLNPEKGWKNSAFEGRYGMNYVGLRNRFTILDENYPYTDFKTRILASYAFVQAILQFTNENISQMTQLAKEADLRTRSDFFKEELAVEYETSKLFELTVQSFEFIHEKIKPEDQDKYPPWIKDYVVRKTDIHKDYQVDYFAKAVPTRSIHLPEGYVVLPNYKDIIHKLKSHGIIVERIDNKSRTSVQEFIIDEIKVSDQVYQGCVMLDIKGNYKTVVKYIPEHSYFISMEQPLARLIPILLEPESVDSLVRWGFFNKVLIKQWGDNRPNFYPVFRLQKYDNQFDLIQ